MQSRAKDKEWGVKSIKQRRSDEHGNIEFLVEWDGDWMSTWEPQEVLGNAQVAINGPFLRTGSGGNPAHRPRRTRQEKSRHHGASKRHGNWPNFKKLKVFSLNSAEVVEN